jgi:DNA-binding IclR family transcriptional regulator
MSTVQSVDRALQVLDILARDGERGVTEIAARLDVHKSTASRLIASLEEHDLVEQDPDPAGRGRYRLGVGLLRLAGATTARLDVVQEARPPAKALAQATGETVNIAVLSEGAALYLDQHTGGAALPSHNWVGQRIPLHATSNGKVLLSGMADGDVRVLLGQRLPAFTASTITDPATLVAQLAGVRERGYVVVVDELEQGLTAVAAPIRNLHGDVVASMSVSGPTFRFGGSAVDHAARVVVEHARVASRRMGWPG